jgi:hypothetical protein
LLFEAFLSRVSCFSTEIREVISKQLFVTRIDASHISWLEFCTEGFQDQHLVMSPFSGEDMSVLGLPVDTALEGSDGAGRGVKRGTGDTDASKAKRTCLRHYDLPPAQLLNPMGQSGCSEISLDKLWEVVLKGNKAATHFSNLCFEDDKRRNIGISQAAEVLHKAVVLLEANEHLKIILQERVLHQALEEAAALKPHLQLLNAGPRGRSDTGSIRSVAYATTSVGAASGVPDMQTLLRSGTALFEWLTQETSVLRSLLSCLAAGGLFFSAHCHERVLRAFVVTGIPAGLSKPERKDVFLRAACSRGSPGTSAAGADKHAFD